LKEIQAEQEEGNSQQKERLETLEAHKAEIEAAIKRVLAMAAKADVPEYLIEQMLGEENQKLKLTNAEIEKVRQEIATPLTDNTIRDIVTFSAALHSKLDTLSHSFEGRRTIIDGLDVSVEAFRKDDEVFIRMRSILNPDGILRSILSPLRTSENLTQINPVVLYRIRRLSVASTIKHELNDIIGSLPLA